ncbi:MAG: restriction endonuclease subunit S [Paracoccaceae bacterium]|nr:restriction endonuclease subunit S [Paracoccaceae bacterium]MDE2673641.1 restriction endonuclease subunit S [Paracoccaceae bacterium]
MRVQNTSGFKQTGIGVIPKDWDIKSYGEVFTFLNTLSNSRADLCQKGDFGYIHYGDIHTRWDNTLDLSIEELPELSRDKIKKQSALIRDGDLVIADASEDYEGIAKSVEVKNLGNNKVLSGLHTFLLRDQNLVFSDGFRGYIHETPVVHQQIQKVATGLKVFGVSKNNLKEVLIPIPKPEEQEAIAAVLSDVDGLIEKLERLIAKKRDVKIATMQQLLTGKNRLPGFDGVWNKKLVDDFGEILTGSTPSTKVTEYWNGDIPWVTPTDINQKKDIEETERKISNVGLSVSKKLPTGSVLVSCIASIGKNAILSKDGACNQQINAIIPNENYNSDFIYYLMEINKGYLLANSGITATRIISKKDFSKLSFKTPELEEQTAIAEVLSDMDTELYAFEQHLSKTRCLKIGMMQELLTGRIRLIKTEKMKETV